MKFIKLFSLIILLCNCNNISVDTSSIESALKKHFQTDNLSLYYVGNDILSISVRESDLILIERENWKTMEPFASIGAIIVYNQITNLHPNNVKKIEFKLENQHYVYHVEEIAKVLKYLDIIHAFFDKINNNLSIKEYFSNSIQQADQQKIMSTLSGIGKIELQGIHAFIKDNNTLSIYITLNIGNDRFDSLKFIFDKNSNEDKIIGIHSW